jgi:hypothetical protein
MAGAGDAPARAVATRVSFMVARRMAPTAITTHSLARETFCLEKNLSRVELLRSLKRRKQFRSSQSNVWEPGEIPGRLRHCNGYEFQCH